MPTSSRPGTPIRCVSMFSLHDDLDLALVDLTMPGMGGAQTIGELCREFLRCR